MTNVLVTGGCGFIGRHVVDALLARGDIVRVLDVDATFRLPLGVELVHGSIVDHRAVAAALDGIDIVYHVAGIAHLWARDRNRFDLVNRRGTEIVLAAAKAKQTRRVVHCSTESILLPKAAAGDRLIDEAAAPSLGDMPGPYTRSKYRGEQAALAAARDGLDVVVVNPTVPIGAGDRNMTPPAKMLALFLAGGSPFYLDCVLNLVDVRDLAHGMLLAAERGKSGERYILGGENIALRNLLPQLATLSGRPMPKRAIPPSLALAAGLAAEQAARLLRTTPVATLEGVRIALRSAPFDSGKARRDLGYAPRPVADALAEAVAWLSEGETEAERPLPEPRNASFSTK